ncbi:MAG: type II toxin-antitoxin system RelE/ParE family toxin [bacterium]
MRKVKLLITPDGKCPVRDFIDTLPVKTQAKTYATFKIVQNTEIVPEKFFKKMSGSELYEIRVLHDKILYRYLSFFHSGNIVVVAHGFEKRSKKTAEREITTAIQRMKDFEEQFKRGKS